MENRNGGQLATPKPDPITNNSQRRMDATVDPQPRSGESHVVERARRSRSRAALYPTTIMMPRTTRGSVKVNEAVVNEIFAFDGQFAFSRSYPLDDAQQPHMVFEGVGPVDVPVGEQHAEGIIGAATLVALGVWELPAEEISFQDPSWDDWIQRRVGKLVLQEEGCDFKFSIPESSPSSCRVISTRVCYAGQTNSFKFFHLSNDTIFTVAAYPGVEQVLGSVANGYRVSLMNRSRLYRTSPSLSTDSTRFSVLGRRTGARRTPETISSLCFTTDTPLHNLNLSPPAPYAAATRASSPCYSAPQAWPAAQMGFARYLANVCALAQSTICPARPKRTTTAGIMMAPIPTQNSIQKTLRTTPKRSPPGEKQ
uniref:Uncharacterized protein n=1 Tax=Mycena chlorophos TaxID=658473 RepID=A0ABQ0LCP8_MYCCL|nr:predicted protein [Mycena chlorophos]